jgi:hypothetical protein
MIVPATPTTTRDLMVALQRLFIEQLAADWPLTEPLSPGDNIVSVLQSSKFRAGDDVFVKSVTPSPGKVEPTTIAEVYAWDPALGYRVRIDPPVQGWWLVGTDPYNPTRPYGSSLLKAVNHQPLKRVFKGDLRRIPDFPSISISLPDEDNEWSTIRATDHTYNFKIRAYTMADNFETGTEYIAKFAEQVREVLLDHVHPLVDYFSLPLAADLPLGSTIVQMDVSTAPLLSLFARIVPGDRVYLRDGEKRPAGTQEGVVQSILGPGQARLSTTTQWDFLVSRGAEFIVARKYLYDTRPSRISYGFVPSNDGSFLNAAEVGYFAKEMVCRAGTILT